MRHKDVYHVVSRMAAYRELIHILVLLLLFFLSGSNVLDFSSSPGIQSYLRVGVMNDGRRMKDGA